MIKNKSMEQIAKELRETNEKNGWFNLPFEESNGDTIGLRLMGIIELVCDMLEEYRNHNKQKFEEEMVKLESRIRILRNHHLDKLWEKQSERRDVAQHLILSISEHSEAFKAWKKRDKENFNEEIADTFIRLLSDFVKQHNIPITREIELKHKINQGRGYRHGNKRV